MADWKDFAKSMQSNYNIKMDSLTDTYDKEQADYFIHSGLWTELSPEHLVGQSTVMKTLDLNTCTLEDAEAVDQLRYSMRIPFPTKVSGFAGWFTTDFAGSDSNPATKRIILSTGPEVGYTHWGQQVFYLRDAIECAANTTISGSLAMVRQTVNKRLYDMIFSVTVNEEEEKQYKYEIP